MLLQAALGLNDRMLSDSEYIMRRRRRFGASNLVRSDKSQSCSSVRSWGVLTRREIGWAAKHCFPTSHLIIYILSSREFPSWGAREYDRFEVIICSMRMVRGRFPDRANQHWSREGKNGLSGWTSAPGSSTLMRNQISGVECATSRQWRHTRVKSRGGLAKFADMVVVPIEKILLGQFGMSLTRSKNTACRTSTGSRCIMAGYVVQVNCQIDTRDV